MTLRLKLLSKYSTRTVHGRTIYELIFTLMDSVTMKMPILVDSFYLLNLMPSTDTLQGALELKRGYRICTWRTSLQEEQDLRVEELSSW